MMSPKQISTPSTTAAGGPNRESMVSRDQGKAMIGTTSDPEASAFFLRVVRGTRTYSRQLQLPSGAAQKPRQSAGTARFSPAKS